MCAEGMNTGIRAPEGHPHIWLTRGNWHCAQMRPCGATVMLWPRGVGDSPRTAYEDYARRAKEWPAK